MTDPVNIPRLERLYATPRPAAWALVEEAEALHDAFPAFLAALISARARAADSRCLRRPDRKDEPDPGDCGFCTVCRLREALALFSFDPEEET